MATLLRAARQPVSLALLLALIALGLAQSLGRPAPAAAWHPQSGRWQLRLDSLWTNREDESADEPYLVVIGFSSQLGVPGSTRIIRQKSFGELDEQAHTGEDAKRASIPRDAGLIEFGEIENEKHNAIVGAIVVAMEHDTTYWSAVRTVFDRVADEVRMRITGPIESGNPLSAFGGGSGGTVTAFADEIGAGLKDAFDSALIEFLSPSTDNDEVVGVQVLVWSAAFEPQNPPGCPDRPWEDRSVPIVIMRLGEVSFDRPGGSAAAACRSLRFDGSVVGDSPAIYDVSGAFTSVLPRGGELVEPRSGSNHWGSVPFSVDFCGGCHRATAVNYFATYDKGDGQGVREYLVASAGPFSNPAWGATWDITGVAPQRASVRAEIITLVGAAKTRTHEQVGLNIETTPPTGQLTEPVTGGIGGRSVRVTAQVADTQSGVDRVSFWYDAGSGQQAIAEQGRPINGFSIVWRPGSLPEGSPVSIGGTVYDKQGNSAKLTPVTITLDLTPPTVTSVYPDPASPPWITSRTKVNLRASASDPGGAIAEVRFTAFYKDASGRNVEQFVGADSVANLPNQYSVEWDVSGIPDQANRTAPYELFVLVVAIDQGGNASPLTGSSGGRIIGFDRAPPALRVVSPNTWVATSQPSFPIEVTATDALGVGNKVVQLTVTALYREPGATSATTHTLAGLANVTGWTGSLALAGLPEQTVTIAAEARDEAGFVTTHAGNIKIDRTPPAVSGVSHSPNPFVTSGTRTLSINYRLSEQASSVSVSLYNAAGGRVRELRYTSVNTDPKVALWDARDAAGNLVASGSYTYRIEATDAAGNVGSYQGSAFNVTVDTAAAVVSVVLTPSPLSLASGAPLNIRYEQNEAARAEIEVLNSAGQVIRYLGAWQESAGIYNRTWDRRNAAGVVVAPATYTVRLRVTDLAGNVATLTRSVQVQP